MLKYCLSVLFAFAFVPTFTVANELIVRNDGPAEDGPMALKVLATMQGLKDTLNSKNYTMTADSISHSLKPFRDVRANLAVVGYPMAMPDQFEHGLDIQKAYIKLLESFNLEEDIFAWALENSSFNHSKCYEEFSAAKNVILEAAGYLDWNLYPQVNATCSANNFQCRRALKTVLSFVNYQEDTCNMIRILNEGSNLEGFNGTVVGYRDFYMQMAGYAQSLANIGLVVESTFKVLYTNHSEDWHLVQNDFIRSFDESWETIERFNEFGKVNSFEDMKANSQFILDHSDQGCSSTSDVAECAVEVASRIDPYHRYMSLEFRANHTDDWATRHSPEWTEVLKSTSPQDNQNQYLIVSRMPVSNQTGGGVSQETYTHLKACSESTGKSADDKAKDIFEQEHEHLAGVFVYNKMFGDEFYNGFDQQYLTVAMDKNECFAWTFGGCCGNEEELNFLQ